MTGTEPRAIVGPPSMRWHNSFPVQGGSLAGSLGTGEIVDMGVMGEGRHH